MKKETGMACMPWHLRTRGTNGNRLPDTDGKVPGDLGYGPATFQMTYIPGTYNNGNVYFAWMRFQF